MTRFANKHVLIVGASEGIGLSLAKQAASRGLPRLSLIARRPDRLAAAATEVQGVTGSEVAWQSADACDPDVVADAVAKLVAEHGPIDIAVTCVGGAKPGYFADLPVAEFQSQMDLNFFSALNVSKAVLPGMVERGSGHLVFTASTAALLGVFGYTSYAASKWALRGFAETLRYEVEPAGVRLSVAFPPDTLTPGYETENLSKPPETVAVSGGIKPRTPEKVAAAIVAGIERDRFLITADGQTRLLTRFAGVLDPFVRSTMRRQIAKASAGVSSTESSTV